jgi:hypothetical protein
MTIGHFSIAPAAPLFAGSPALACEPVIPFMQVMAPALALYESVFVLVAAVALKSVLFAIFERRLSRVQAAWRMFLGNVLTSLVGALVGAMIASGPGVWLVGVPVVFLLCWLTSRRFADAAPMEWLARTSPALLATVMTILLLASCVLFASGQEAIRAHQLALYWVLKFTAIAFALLASVTLTTVWEEWIIWRLSSRPKGAGFFPTVLRANLYVLVAVMAVPAAMSLPKRLKSPDFLAKRPPSQSPNRQLASTDSCGSDQRV